MSVDPLLKRENPGAQDDAEQCGSSLNELPVDSQDVENCFLLLLGRKADRQLLDRPKSIGISELLREILETETFQTSVLRPMLLRELLPHALLEVPPSWRLMDWAQRRLPMHTSTRMTLGATRTWAHLLEVLLSDQTFLAVSKELAATEIDITLQKRLEKEPFWKAVRSILGAVDAASAFEVRGWAVNICDKATPVIVEVLADSAFVGCVQCSEFRADVQDAIGGSGNFGFTFKISAAHRAGFGGGRTLTLIDSVSRTQIGEPTMVYSDAILNWDIIAQTRKELTEIRGVLDRIEARLPDIGRKASVPLEAYSEYWERFYRLSAETLHEQRERSRQFDYRPLISIIVPTWNSDTRLLHKAIESAVTQTYDHWEIVVSDDASDRDELRSLLRGYSGDIRVRWIEATERGGIAVNTNRAIDASRGEYIAFLDHDDELSAEALFHVVAQLQDHRYGLLYSDEDRIEEDEFGREVHHTPFFKPGFDPDLLLSMNYICHLVVLSREIVARVQGLRSGFEGAQDHDLLLRVIEVLPAKEILHLPRVLYHWRVTPGSVSQSPQSIEGVQKNIVSVVEDHLSRNSPSAKVERHSDPIGAPRLFATRVHWPLPPNPPGISIIIPTRDRVDLLQPCVRSVLDSIVEYPGPSEVLLVDNDSVEPGTRSYFSALSPESKVRLIRYRGPFNWSAINNAAAREAAGDVLIFLNNDTIVLARDWCTELVANALREDVGAVGARLLYADGTIQHAGVLTGIEGVAGHECVGDTPLSGGYFGRSQLLRSASAVTGACLATRRALFHEMDGGFDELDLKVAFNDVDYCMRLRKAGYRIIYNPFAVLYHLESKSRGREVSQEQSARSRSEARFFRVRWSEGEIVDPYYNLHFERFSRPFERLRPPPEISSHWNEHAISGEARGLDPSSPALP